MLFFDESKVPVEVIPVVDPEIADTPACAKRWCWRWCWGYSGR
ncbi:MAG TPA: hypothetical protein VIG66_05535 [Noviherbaspirillum sp.]